MSGAMHVLVIDLSYFVFYRFYALVHYFKLSQKRTDFTNVVDDPEFLAKFTELFRRNVMDLIQKHLGVKRRRLLGGDTKNAWGKKILVVFAKDCSRCDIWRNSIYPDYKKNRDHQKHGVPFDGRIFDHVIKSVLPDLLNEFPFIRIVEAPGAEADDIAAVLCRRMGEYRGRNRGEGGGDEIKYEHIVVITNDHDYLQLLDYIDGIYNLQGHDLSMKALSGPSVKNMYMKVLLGDPSDNISGVVTKREAKQLMEQIDTLDLEGEGDVSTNIDAVIRSFLSPKVSLEEIYDRNKKLICFDNIPDIIVRDIDERWSTITDEFE
jgi:5'-3' exonuclease